MPYFQLSTVDFSSIDVILISNWMSLLGLPYITEYTGFQGLVYCTDPTRELGQLAMDEMAIVMDNMRHINNNLDWKNSGCWKNLGKVKAQDPNKWKHVYTKKDVDNCLRKCSLISFGETKVSFLWNFFLILEKKDLGAACQF